MVEIVLPSNKEDKISKIIKPNKPVNALVKLMSKFLNCLEKTWAKAKNNAIKLAKNKPRKLLVNIGSKNIIKIPRNEVKINSHFFLLIFSLRIKALAIIPKGIANCEPSIIGEIIDE